MSQELQRKMGEISGYEMRSQIIKSILLAFALATVALTSSAHAKTIKQTVNGDAATNPVIAAIAHHQILVDRVRPITVCENGECDKRDSHLRVAIVTLDNGPSTDVSPRYSMLLTMHNSVDEFAVASSVHGIDVLQELISVKRLKAGIYQIDYIGIDLGKGQASCPFPKIRTTVDARDLSIAVRQAKKAKFFEDAFYTDPIYLTKTVVGCKEE